MSRGQKTAQKLLVVIYPKLCSPFTRRFAHLTAQRQGNRMALWWKGDRIEHTFFVSNTFKKGAPTTL
jgi:hypothetical protein